MIKRKDLSPAKVERKFPDSELEDSLKKFFEREGVVATILMDGHEARSDFKRAGVNYGIDKRFLKVVERINESQYTALVYGLTDKGKKYFGLAA